MYGEEFSYDYVEHFHKSLSDESRWVIKKTYEIYKKRGLKGKLLEIGGGPTVYQLLSPSLYVDDITFTDLSIDNLQRVQDWINSDDNNSWSLHADLVASLTSQEYSSKSVEKLLKNKIVNLKVLDIAALEFSDIEESFNVVSSAFCIDVASKDLDQFFKNIMKIHKFLKPGGAAILIFALNCEFYRVKKTKYYPIRYDLKTTPFFGHYDRSTASASS